MKYELLYQPSFAVARLHLEHGEAIRAESGAMLSMSPSIELQSKVQGGLGKALGRLLTGESFFQTTFTAVHGAGEIMLAPPGPGDIIALNPGAGMVVTTGNFLAGDVGLQTETGASMKGFFSGEGLFLSRIRGDGLLLVGSFGAIHRIDLQPGQQYVVDSGHLVAYTDGMGYEVRKAARGLIGTVTSGEGLVVILTGPGTVYLQTRTAVSFANLLQPHIGGSS